MEIVKHPNPVLRQSNRHIDRIKGGLLRDCKKMYNLLMEEKGLGIAGPQVGINRRFFILDLGGRPVVMFNPVIKVARETRVEDTEGCLSCPGAAVKIERFDYIIIEFRDINNKLRSIEANGLLARVIQHELDHLDGKLIIDYMSDGERETYEEELSKLTERIEDVG